MTIRADASGIFVPAVKSISSGRWMEKGMILGEIVSEKSTIYAYALDRELNRIHIDDKVELYLRDDLKTYHGRIAAVNPVAVTFRDSTLVQAMGGLVPCYPNPKTREFTPVNVLYCITIETDRPLPFRSGIICMAEVKKSYRLSVELVRQLMHIFYREFSF